MKVYNAIPAQFKPPPGSSHELLITHQQHNPDPFRLDTRIQLPKFVGKSNGEVVDAWIRSLSTYFNTFPNLTEERKLHIAALQLEGISQTWWDTEQEKTSFMIELGDAPRSSTSQPIRRWDHLCDALRDRFYPPGYIQSLWIIWHQFHQLPT